MMKPEDRIERSNFDIGHMTPLSTSEIVNVAIVDRVRIWHFTMPHHELTYGWLPETGKA